MNDTQCVKNRRRKPSSLKCDVLKHPDFEIKHTTSILPHAIKWKPPLDIFIILRLPTGYRWRWVSQAVHFRFSVLWDVPGGSAGAAIGPQRITALDANAASPPANPTTPQQSSGEEPSSCQWVLQFVRSILIANLILLNSPALMLARVLESYLSSRPQIYEEAFSWLCLSALPCFSSCLLHFPSPLLRPWLLRGSVPRNSSPLAISDAQVLCPQCLEVISKCFTAILVFI